MQGKTLSIICSSMQWLRDNRGRPATVGVRGVKATSCVLPTLQHEKQCNAASSPETLTMLSASGQVASDASPRTSELDWIDGFEIEQQQISDRIAAKDAEMAAQGVDTYVELARYRVLERRTARKRRRADAGVHILGRAIRREAGSHLTTDGATRLPSLPAARDPDLGIELAFEESPVPGGVPCEPAGAHGSSSSTSRLARSREGTGATAGLEPGDGTAAARVADAMRAEREAPLNARTSASSGDRSLVPQLIFASRTHSQLTQFVGELRKTAFADARVVVLAGRSVMCVNPAVRGLGHESRVSERCQELQDDRRKDMRQTGGGNRTAGAQGQGTQAGTKRGKPETTSYESGSTSAGAHVQCGCSFLNADGIQRLVDRLVVEPADVEQAVSRGTEEEGCPYYAARKAIPLAEIVALPYSLLVYDGARYALGIDLRGSVVVVDEGHNLPSAVNGSFSVEVHASQFMAAAAQVSTYVSRYGSRVRASSLTACKVLYRVLGALIRTSSGGAYPLYPLVEAEAYASHRSHISAREAASSLSVSVFLDRSGLADAALSPLCTFLEDSHLCRVARGIADEARRRIYNGTGHRHDKSGTKTKRVDGDKPPTPPVTQADRMAARHPAALYTIRSLLEALARPQYDGCVVVRPQQVSGAKEPKSSETPEDTGSGRMVSHGGMIRYTVLHPARCFTPILEQARAVVLAGGTMRPTGVVVSQLAPSLPSESVRLFSCGHVVPDASILGVSIGRGPSGMPLEFTFKTRRDPRLREELGRTLLQLAGLAPRGMVVFLPSYDFERAMLGPNEVTGSMGDLTSMHPGAAPEGSSAESSTRSVQIQGTPTSLLQRLQSRKPVFREPPSASAVGPILHKFEEEARTGTKGALLFAVMGGKLSEGLNFKDDLARLVIVVGLPYPNARDPELAARMSRMDTIAGKGAGRTLYEGLCFYSVNQAVGRAIRHVDDWAAVCLLDRRFLQAGTQSYLPPWIARRTTNCDTFGQAFRALGAFYKAHRDRTTSSSMKE